MFKHNIYGDQPEVPDGMPDSSNPLPPEFFVNPRCPPIPTATKATIVEVDQSEVVDELGRSPPVGDFVGTSQVLFFFFFF